MKFDDLMTAWKTQDAAPLHEVNQRLLQEALRQDEARLQRQRGQERRLTYVASAFVGGLLALLLATMIWAQRRTPLTVVDWALGVGGVAAAGFAAGSLYASHRAQARREQAFGESLREELRRRLAQVEAVLAGARRRSVSFLLMGAWCPLAILHLGMRVNEKSLADVSWPGVAAVVLCFWMGRRGLHREVREAEARRSELERLVRELDERAG